MRPAKPRGRFWAYTGAILGGLVSVAANVAHSFIHPAGAPDSWQPLPGAVFFATVWPVFLFIVVEILVRIVWPKGWSWRLLRFGGLLPVAAVAAFVSYKHLSGLLAYYGEEPIVCVLGPLAVDGMMIMATGAMLAINHNTRAATYAAVSAATFVASPVPVPAVVPTVAAAVAPVAVVAPTQVVAAAAVPVASAPTSAPASASIPVSVVSSPPANTGESAIPTRAVKPPAVASTPSAATISGIASDAVPPSLPVPAALLTRASHIARAHFTAHAAPITSGELAVRLHVDSKVAGQLLAVLDLQPDSPTKPVHALNGSSVKATR